jgi:hypothetical protein
MSHNTSIEYLWPQGPHGQIDTRQVALQLMGTLVRVFMVMHRHDEGDSKQINRTWKSVLHESRTGWVVGCRRLANGIYNPAAGYEQASLDVKSTVPVLLVAFWPSERSVFVPLDGYKIAFTAAIGLGGDKPYPSGGYGSGKQREVLLQEQSKFMKLEVKKMKRDEYGRFLKGGV